MHPFGDDIAKRAHRILACDDERALVKRAGDTLKGHTRTAAGSVHDEGDSRVGDKPLEVAVVQQHD